VTKFIKGIIENNEYFWTRYFERYTHDANVAKMSTKIIKNVLKMFLKYEKICYKMV